MKPIFVVYTQDTCPYCSRFIANDYPTLKRRIDGSGDFSLYHIDTGRTRPLDLNLYPEDLLRLSKLVPAFIIINTSSWRRRDRLEAEVYGMKFDEKGDLQRDPAAKPYTVDTLIEWSRTVSRKPNIIAEFSPSSRSSPTVKKSSYEMGEIF